MTRIGWSAGFTLRNEGGAGMPRRQQRHRRGDRRLHVDGGAVDVPVQVELHHDVAAAGGARRGHLVDAGNGRELPLERARDRRGHRARIAARQIGADEDRRIVHVGRSLIGRTRYATTPKSAMAAISRLVAIGRLDENF